MTQKAYRDKNGFESEYNPEKQEQEIKLEDNILEENFEENFEEEDFTNLGDEDLYAVFDSDLYKDIDQVFQEKNPLSNITIRTACDKETTADLCESIYNYHNNFIFWSIKNQSQNMNANRRIVKIMKFCLIGFLYDLDEEWAFYLEKKLRPKKPFFYSYEYSIEGTIYYNIVFSAIKFNVEELESRIVISFPRMPISRYGKMDISSHNIRSLVVIHLRPNSLNSDTLKLDDSENYILFSSHITNSNVDGNVEVDGEAGFPSLKNYTKDFNITYAPDHSLLLNLNKWALSKAKLESSLSIGSSPDRIYSNLNLKARCIFTVLSDHALLSMSILGKGG